MALLFLKKKLFQLRNQKYRVSSMNRTWRKANTNPATGKPLLGDSDHDIESRNGRFYDTFGRCISNDGSTIGSSGNSTQARINPHIISDAMLGLSDDVTVPFALSAGLSALGKTKVVVLGGLAELAAGAISMGLGGYVGAKSEA
jgi:hypothetical protein